MKTRDSQEGSRSRKTVFPPVAVSEWFNMMLLLALLSCLSIQPTWAWLDQSQYQPTNQVLTPTNAGFVHLPAVIPVQNSNQLNENMMPSLASLTQDFAAPKIVDLPNQQASSKETDDKTANSIGPLPAAGRILELETLNGDQTARHTKSSDNSTSASKLSQVALQIIKPKKSSSDPTKQVAQMEQKIINQHARVHSFPSSSSYGQSNGMSSKSSAGSSSYHRLIPHKQRDQGILSSLLSGQASNSNSNSDANRDWPWQNLLDSLKSGMMKRSSIVKAISDNRVARSKYN